MNVNALPSETLICPGHGPLTTVAEEKEHNPFFRFRLWSIKVNKIWRA
jgi:glyoxylase-like metal-dependent hydrolase (beta-lactamase superfamily II)